MSGIPTVDYASCAVRRDLSRVGLTLGLIGCGVGAVAALLPLWPLWTFYHVPVGTSMRPMGLTLILGLFAMAGLFVAFPLSVICAALGWRHRRAWCLACLGVLLSAWATSGGFWLFNWIVAARGFVLEP
jgi:hypothetical protein